MVWGSTGLLSAERAGAEAQARKALQLVRGQPLQCSLRGSGCNEATRAAGGRQQVDLR